MSEVLRAPWLLQTVLDDLSNDKTNTSGLNHLHLTPKLVQIIQFMKSGSDSTHMLAHLSDKFHYIVSFFSDKSLGNFARKHSNWSIMDIQGAIIRVLEYRIVKVPCSGDSEVGDSVVLVVEEFEHVGSDGSSVFGDPRYVPINPAVRASLQRPAPPSPSKKDGLTGQEYSFTQSLDPTDLLFLESTCTQTFQRQFTTFPQVISDCDWKIPVEQVKILEGIKLMQIETFEYEAGSDVELSEDENEKAKRAKVNSQISDVRPVNIPVTSSQVTSQILNTLAEQSQYPTTQALMTQAPMTQAPLTQAPMTQAPLTQSSQLFSTQTQTQSPLCSGPVIFPETQLPSSSNSAVLGVTQSSPLRVTKEMAKKYERSPVKMKDVMSSPMKSAVSSPMKSAMSSPMKSAMSSPNVNVSPNKSPVKNNISATPVKFASVNVFESPLVNEVIKTTIETAEIPSSPISSPVKKSSVAVVVSEAQKTPEPVIEYPDYSSW